MKMKALNIAQTVESNEEQANKEQLLCHETWIHWPIQLNSHTVEVIPPYMLHS